VAPTRGIGEGPAVGTGRAGGVTTGRLLVGALVVSLVGVALCATVAGATRRTRSGGSSPTLTVVAAENFWGSIVKQLAGAKATVTSVIANPSTDPHSYEAKPSDERSIASARYVVVNGIGYDPWATQALNANPSSGRKVLVVGDLLGLHAGDNPHQWYSPDSVQRFVDRATTDLQSLDAKDATYFATQRTTFVNAGLAQYHALIDQIRTAYAGTPVGASENIVSPLAVGLGLNLITPPSFLKAIAEGTDPTAADKETIDQQLKSHQIKVFMFNSQNSTPDVAAIVKEARAAQIPVTTVTETLTPASATFQAWQVTELSNLRAALTKAAGP
jgi:zinc/manganese transport system substrate-binding protein